MNLNYLDLLPDEMLLKLLVETDDLETLSKWCQTSKRVNRIYQDEGLWKQKYLKDFGETKLIESETWRELYKRRTLNINSPISSGRDHYGIIDQKGNLYMVGNNKLGQLGVGKDIKKSEIPILVNFPGKYQKVISISASSSNTGAVTEDGKVYFWGFNGQEIFFSYTDNNPYIWLPKELISLPSIEKARKIVISEMGYIVLLEDGSVYFSVYDYHVDYNISFMKGHLKLDAIDISVGGDFDTSDGVLAIITKDHKLYMWGDLIDFIKNSNDIISKPKYMPLPEPVIKVVLGTDYAMVLSTTGNVYTFGRNMRREFWIGSDTEMVHKPILVRFPEKIVQIETYAALSITGRLYMWGSNLDNKIESEFRGGLTKSTYFRPAEISFGVPVNFVSVGNSFTIAVSNDGVVNYWDFK